MKNISVKSSFLLSELFFINEGIVANHNEKEVLKNFSYLYFSKLKDLIFS